LAVLIAPDAALDAAKWGSHAWGNGSTSPCCPQSLMEAAEELRDYYLPERRRQLYDGLASGARELPDAQPAETVIDFGIIDTNPASGNLDEQYIELVNPNYFAVDISGWELSIGQDRGTHLFTFKGGTVIPANGSIRVAANRVALRHRNSARRGGPILFIVGDFDGRLAAKDEIIILTDQRQVIVNFIVTGQTGE
jgi:hypothetical protein